jgi:hypothetical protein
MNFTSNSTGFTLLSPQLGPFGWTMLWIFVPLLISSWVRLVWYKAHRIADVVPESGVSIVVTRDCLSC